MQRGKNISPHSGSLARFAAVTRPDPPLTRRARGREIERVTQNMLLRNVLRSRNKGGSCELASKVHVIQVFLLRGGLRCEAGMWSVVVGGMCALGPHILNLKQQRHRYRRSFCREVGEQNLRIWCRTWCSVHDRHWFEFDTRKMAGTCQGKQT